MSFLSVLKKIGQEINTADQLIPVYGPLIHAVTASIGKGADDKATEAIQTVTDGLTRFQNIILDAEVMGQAISTPGPQKAQMAAPAILQLFLDLPAIKGKKPKDAVQSKADAAELGGALAKLLNGFEG